MNTRFATIAHVPTQEETEMADFYKKYYYAPKVVVCQHQVDSAIEHLLKAAEPFEEAREAAEFESMEYWKHHDSAMNLILAAECLMV